MVNVLFQGPREVNSLRVRETQLDRGQLLRGRQKLGRPSLPGLSGHHLQSLSASAIRVRLKAGVVKRYASRAYRLNCSNAPKLSDAVSS